MSRPPVEAAAAAEELRNALAQQPAAVDGAATNSAVAAIQFALKDPEGMTFLRLWNEGDFDTLRREWPDAPVEVYIDADPLAAQQPAAVDEAMVERALNARYNGYDVACFIDEKADGRGVIRAALTAALAGQQGGSDNDR